jgi:TP901 family phage tail tape measure protein
MGLLREQAQDLGADLTLPGTSAADAADAMLELSKAGLSVQDTMDGVRGTLQLSAAGQLSNAAAAEVTANALNAFHLEGKEAARVADLLAASANASSGEVVDMADALKMSAAVAYSASLPIEDLVTGISLMANAGIKGSDAGTSLKQMLLSLQAPTDKAKNLMSDLGISVYDAQGSMLPMVDIIGEFSGALSGLTQEQRNAALATIFGSDAVRAANIVLMGGVDAWGQMSGAVNESGAAAGLAAAMMEGLAGSVGNLQSAAETAALEGFELLKEDAIELIDTVTEAINAFNEMEDAEQRQIVNIGLIAAATGPAIYGIGALAKGFLAVKSAAAALPGILTGIQAGIAAIGVTATAVSTGGLALLILGLDKAFEANARNNAAGEQAAKGLEIQLGAIQSGADGWEDYVAKASAALSNQHLMVKETEDGIRVWDGQSGVLKDVTNDLNLLNKEEYAIYQRQQQASAAALQAADAMGMLNDGTLEYKDGLLQVNEELERANGNLGDVPGVAMEASAIMDLFTQSLQDAKWAEEGITYAGSELAISLGLTDEATVQLNDDVTLLSNAFAAGAISADELAGYMQQAKSGTLQLSEAERSSIQAATDHATALRDNALAAQEAALAQLDLAQSLKGASDAQIAQAAINELTKALDAGTVAFPDYVTAVSGVQEAFGLVDEKSQAIAGGVAGLVGALETGVLPAENVAGALGDIIADAEDGDIHLGNILTKFGEMATALTPAQEAYDLTGERMNLLLETAETTSQGVMDAYSAKGWLEMGTGITTDIAGGMDAGAADVSASAGGTAQTVADAFNAGGWLEIGKAIDAGIADGIDANTGIITAAARKAIQEAIAAAEAEAGIESPSKLFAERVGAPISAGIAEGILDNRDLPRRAVAATVSGMAQVGGGTSYSTTINAPITMQATMRNELDLFQQAKIIAEYIREYNL